jgi:hypothetical protein
MRACEPSDDGVVERGGVKIHYEVYGEGRPTILLLPTWAIGLCRTKRFIEACIRVRCPVLVIHGDADRIRPHHRARLWPRRRQGRS